MKIWKKIFGKKERQPKAESDIESINFDELDAVEKKAGKNLGNEIGQEQELIACCERIMERTNELKREKEEYDILTGYLNDTQIIDGLPENEKQQLMETATNILNISKTKDSYAKQSKRISDERISEFDTMKDEIPRAVQQLKSNEAYQSMVKHDMQHLDGEKSAWGYERTMITEQQSLFQKLLFAVFAVFLISAAVFTVLTMGYGMDLTLIGSVVEIVVVAIGFLFYLLIQQNVKKLKTAEANLNRAITLSNQMKAKYVNITRAVDFAYEKYHVRSAYEFQYLWDEYLHAVKEREGFERANEDLEYYNRVMIRQLRNYQLYDASIWPHQAEALADRKEMVEVKHHFLERRQNVRKRMDSQAEGIRQERMKIKILTEGHTKLKDEISEILESVDQLLSNFAFL